MTKVVKTERRKCSSGEQQGGKYSTPDRQPQVQGHGIQDAFF